MMTVRGEGRGGGLFLWEELLLVKGEEGVNFVSFFLVVRWRSVPPENLSFSL